MRNSRSFHISAASIILAVFIAFLFISTDFYVISNLNHPCRKADCPVCRQLESAFWVTHQFMSDFHENAVTAICMVFFIVSFGAYKSAGLIQSLISLKVRLNN